MLEHLCLENRSDSIRIIYAPSFYSSSWKKIWVLSVQNIANEQAVHDEQADYVGQIMCEHLLGIKFCPYCGIELKAPEDRASL